MTPADVVARVHISDVADALGAKLDRARRRCVATWREGRKFSVSLDDTKNCWHDFAANEGGGLIDFVARVRGCDRKAALEWLAACAGVPLDQQTETERRQWARRMQTARPEAEKLAAWKIETLEALRNRRNEYMRIYWGAVGYITSHDAFECVDRGNLAFELALSIGETYWDRVEALDEQIDRLDAASYSDLLRKFGCAA